MGLILREILDLDPYWEPDQEVGPVLEIDETHGLASRPKQPLGPLPPHLLAAEPGDAELAEETVDANIAMHAEGGHFLAEATSDSSLVERDMGSACALALGERQDGNGQTKFNRDGSLKDGTHGLAPCPKQPLGPLLAAAPARERPDTFAPDDPSDLEQHFFGGLILGSKGMGPWWARSGPMGQWAHGGPGPGPVRYIAHLYSPMMNVTN